MKYAYAAMAIICGLLANFVYFVGGEPGTAMFCVLASFLSSIMHELAEIKERL